MFAPQPGVQPCLAAPRRLSYLCVLLEDGSVAILSPPSPPPSPSPPTQLQLLRFAVDAPAEAIACSADGLLLAVASGSSLSLYAMAAAEATAPPRANLRWRVDLHALPRGLDVASLTPEALAPAAYGMCAVASSMGVHLLSNSPEVSTERRLLHPGLVVCSKPPHALSPCTLLMHAVHARLGRAPSTRSLHAPQAVASRPTGPSSPSPHSTADCTSTGARAAAGCAHRRSGGVRACRASASSPSSFRTTADVRPPPRHRRLATAASPPPRARAVRGRFCVCTAARAS
eukprot:5075664-Prymnesium_polylepis.1